MSNWTATITASGSPPAPYGIGEIIEALSAEGPCMLAVMIDEATDGYAPNNYAVAITDPDGDSMELEELIRFYA